MLGIFDFHGNDESFKEKEIINKKLNDKDNPPSLEDLLILEGITSEFTRRNKKLIEFCTKEKIKQMLDYIIKEPKVDDYNKAHKFPFICSKILDLNIYDMMKYFFMTRNELIEEKNKKNLDLREYDSSDFDLRSQDDEFFNNDIDFQGYNLNEFNMEDNKNENENNNDNENNEEKKDEQKENNEDEINYKDNNDNVDEQKNDDKLEECNMNENKKDDEDDLVNHIDDEINDKNEKDKDNTENKKEIDKQNEDQEKVKIEENKDKTEDNQGDIINYESSKIKDEEKKEDTEEVIPEEKINHNKTEEEKVEKLNEEKKDIKNTEDNNNNSKKEEIKDEYPEDRIEILDYFLSFLLTDSELNYVLSGYFSSLMTNLLNLKGAKIIHYIYEKRKDILDKLLYHSYNISISEIFFRFLKYGEILYGPIDKENHPPEYKHIAEMKSELIKNLFDTIDINMNTEKLACIFYNMKGFINLPTIFKYMINNNYIINTLINKQLGKFNFSNYIDDKNISYKKNNCVILCDIIILWLNYIKNYDLQIPMLLYEVNEDSDEDTVQQNSTPIPELHHTNLSQAFLDILPDFIKNNFNNENNKEETILQSFNDEKLIPLGLYKIKIVELITSIIFYCRNIPNEIDDILIKSEFMPNLINYIFKYPNNNIYQDAVLHFFDMVFKKEEGCSYHEKLFEYIFSEFNFLAKIKENFPKKIEYEGNMGVGYTPFFVSLSYKINTLMGGTPLNLENNYSKEGVITFNTRGKNPKISGISVSYRITERNQKNENEKNNNKNNNLNIIPCLEKYCNDEWKYFFSEKIANKIKLYEEDLCDIKNHPNNTAEKDDDLFYNPLNDINNNNNEKENEQHLEIGNKRYYDNNNKFVFDDNNENNKKNMAHYKDMEININDFNLDEEINSDKNEEKNNDEFNTVNFWKNNLEKEKNSYVNIVGEDAMKELLEE